jgi:putative transcriptional regulator
VAPMPCFKKPRSKLGKFIDAHDLKQIEVAKVSGVKEATLSRVCNISSVSPTAKNASKILRALRKLTKKNVDYTDFWA